MRRKKKLQSKKPRRRSVTDRLSDARQMLYPPEFRIPSSSWSDDRLAVLEFIRVNKASGPAKRPPKAVEPIAEGEIASFLADVATGLWRMRRKMVDAESGEPLEDMRRVFRHMESIGDAMTQAGVTIQDPVGKVFDSGMSIKVIAFQPTPGVGRETIIETIKPAIYYKDKMVQMGEVIVGTPEELKGRAGDAKHGGVEPVEPDRED